MAKHDKGMQDLSETKGPVQLGRRSFKTFTRKLTTGSAPDNDPENFLTAAEVRDMRSESTLFGKKKPKKAQ